MRRIAAVITGALVASLVLLIIGMIANAINPTPPELMNPETPEVVALRVASASTFTWISTIFGLGFGAFIGGIVGAKVAKDNIPAITLSIGLLLSPWALYTLYIVYPSVLWVPVLMLIFTFLGSYLGGKIA